MAVHRGFPLALAGALTLAAFASACGPRRVASPDARQLAAQSVIRRDDFGIPHILAETEEAAAFAFGYAQAEDHAVEIGRRYVAARGEAALHFGRSAIENDFNMARFDNVAEARRGLADVSDVYRQVIAAYAAGVDTYVSRHRSELPAWMPRITAVDVLASTRASAVNDLGGPTLPRQLRQKYEGAAASEPVSEWIDQPGSNAFALAGSRTASGKPILLGNPHLSWSSLYWEAHVRVPGRIDFYGSTLAGIPVLRAGFNDRLGFVTTNNAPDLDDVLTLQADPERRDAYLFDGRSVRLTRRDLSVRVRNDDGTIGRESRTVWSTHLGPVIHRTDTRIFTVKSTRLGVRYFEGFYVASRARSLRDWLSAMALNLVPTSNFTYADADGNILYLWNGRVPVRQNGADYSLDVEVTRTADLWSKLHSLEELPQLLNPPGGYIQNANNPPQFVSMQDPIDMNRYPSYFERGPLALRPQLALDLLQRAKNMTAADVIRLKFNTRMLLAERVRPELLAAAGPAANASDDLRAGAAVLEAWDGTAGAQSRGAVLFQTFWDGYANEVRQPFAQRWDPLNPASTPSGLADRGAALRQLEAAVRATRRAYGSESVAWGDVNRFRFGAVDLPGDGASGTYGTFRVMRFDRVDGSPARIAGKLPDGASLLGFGDAWVLLVDFAEPVTGWSVLAYGQTTKEASRHSSDQIRVFAAHDLRRAWYTETEIKEHTIREYRPGTR
jgi:acyl-homoserine-lactone acylase